MRVLHVDTGRQMRGGQWQALLLAGELARAGVEQTLLAPEGAPLLARTRDAGLDAAPLGFLALWREARRADVVHAHDARAHTFAILAAPASPLVVSRRVAFPVKRAPLSRWKYRQAAMYLAVSEYVRKQLLSAGVADEKIRLIPDAVEMPAADDDGVRDQVVGLRSDDPGKGGALIREASRQAGVEVVFSSDLTRDLRRAAVFVYISDSEGLGSAALLAMAHGVPVIASRVGGLPEAVEEGVTGLLTENRAEEIARAIVRLRADPALAGRMGAAGRKRAAERYAPRAMAESVLETYRLVSAC